MARTSLLFSLALVIVIASVSAHTHKPKKTHKNICPATLGAIQAYPSIEISKFIEKKAKSGPKSVEFNTLFSICKTYNNQLAAFKVTTVKNVFGVNQAKHTAITRTLLAAESAIGVEGALKLERSYSGMAGCFIKLEKKIAHISAKYKFNANAEISQSDRDKIDRCLIKLKGAISVFVKVISEYSIKFTAVKQIGFVGAKKDVGVGSKLIGLSGHSQAEAEAKVEDKGQETEDGVKGLFERFFDFEGFVKYDVSKAKFRGDGEFKSRNHSSKIHLD